MNKKFVPLALLFVCTALCTAAFAQQQAQGQLQAPDPAYELPARPPAGAQGPGLPTGPTLGADNAPASNANNGAQPTPSGTQPAQPSGTNAANNAPANNAPATGTANTGNATATNVPPAGAVPPPRPNQPGNTVNVPNQAGNVTKENGQFIIKKNVQEVRLYATVVDEKQRIVTDLTQTNFTVYENGQPQRMTSFRREDVPVAVGIVIDNSGSMREKRPAVNQAALNFVKASNPDDKVFIVNFNSEPYLDQDFTAKVPELKDALDRIDSRGGTALYDAVWAASDHLLKARDVNEKKVILVVTDGEDDASTLTLERTVRDIAVDGGPTVYCVGLLDKDSNKRARRALRILAEETGGVAFFPKDINEVDSITREIARDIRNQYILQYAPTTEKAQGGYRQVKVVAQAKGYKALQVRTRSGYYAGQGTAASSSPQNSPQSASK